MAKITDPREMRITAIYADGNIESIIQIQSYQMTGSWVRYFLEDGAENVIVSFNKSLNN